MASLRTLMGGALAAALLVPAGFGCTGLSKTKTDVAKALRLEKPQPASQMLCFWQRRPQHLPDPTRDGVMGPGLVGQLFLLSPNGKPVDITGDLIVQALDETPRRPGQPAATPEIWHIDKVALKKLATKDERFGTCYALFLPWPTNWKDVTNVRMQARYDSKAGVDLNAADVTMTLDFGTPGSEPGGAPSTALKPTGPSDLRGIPDIRQALKGQSQPQGTTPPPSFAGANPAPGMFLPPPAPSGPSGAPVQYTNAGPNGSMITTKVWTDPVPPPPPSMAPQFAGSFAPTVTPPPVQQTNFGQPIPIGPPTFVQPPPLPPAIPVEAGRPTFQPGINGGLPAIELPTPAPLRTVEIPRQ